MDWSLYARQGDGSHAGNNWLRWTTWSGGDIWAGPDLYPQDQWVHVVAAVDGAGAGRLYVNGLQVLADTCWSWGPNPERPSPWALAGVGGPIFPGALDDIRIYNYALDPITIAMITPTLPAKPSVSSPRCMTAMATAASIFRNWPIRLRSGSTAGLFLTVSPRKVEKTGVARPAQGCIPSAG